LPYCGGSRESFNTVGKIEGQNLEDIVEQQKQIL
jgi:hypothetical protein